MRRFIQFGLLFFILIQTITVHADKAMLEQKNVKAFMRDMVNHHQFDKKQLTAILNEAVFQPQIIESMDKPYEKKTWDVYRSLFLTDDRVQAGLRFWRDNQKTLAAVEKQYGVPAKMIVAIIGVETLYGKNQGKYRVLDALTTLAFYYPKRSEFFTKELREYLLLCREQHVPATKFIGSYAGAIGKPQFMPSSYRFFAVDFNGKGRADLMSEDGDVISSVANYFAKHGWRHHDMVAEPAHVVGDAYKHLAVNSKFADYSFSHLVALGVKPALNHGQHPKEAGLIELSTPNGAEYWVAFPNFYVITHYNTSPQYALVVYLLSNELERHITGII